MGGWGAVLLCWLYLFLVCGFVVWWFFVVGVWVWFVDDFLLLVWFDLVCFGVCLLFGGLYICGVWFDCGGFVNLLDDFGWVVVFLCLTCWVFDFCLLYCLLYAMVWCFGFNSIDEACICVHTTIIWLALWVCCLMICFVWCFCVLFAIWFDLVFWLKCWVLILDFLFDWCFDLFDLWDLIL